MTKKMVGEEGFKVGALNPFRGSVLIYGSVMNKIQLIYIYHFVIYLGASAQVCAGVLPVI